MDDSDIVKSALTEAIDKLGLIKPDAIERISHLLSADMTVHPRQTCIEYRKTGDQLSKEDKKANGINGNAFFSRNAFDDLTDLGRLNPLIAHQQTILRANFTVGRYHSLEKLKQIFLPGHGFKGIVKFIGSAPECPFCSDSDGELMKIEEAPVFPPPQCACAAPHYLFIPEISFLDNWNEPDQTESARGSLLTRFIRWFRHE